MDPVEGKVKDIISKIIKIPADKLDRDDDLVEKHGMDSMARIEIVTELETEFDITIDDSETIGLRSVGKCLEFISKQVPPQ